jgi:hypothetical protein
MTIMHFDVWLWVSTPRTQEPATYAGSGMISFPVFVVSFFVFVALLYITISQPGVTWQCDVYASYLLQRASESSLVV